MNLGIDERPYEPSKFHDLDNSVSYFRSSHAGFQQRGEPED